MRHASIKFRLSMAFCLFLFLVTFLGIFNLISLASFNGVTNQIRTHWLPNTRFLGDINNYTSDFRAAEGTLLLASTPDEWAASQQEMEELDRNIAKARLGYEQIKQDDDEINLYKRFSVDWDRYRSIVNRVIALVREHKNSEGIALYKTTSRVAYNAASDTLGELTELNVTKDQVASDSAAKAYGQVSLLTLAAMLFGVFLVVVSIIYIRRSISEPILSLAATMHRLANNDMSGIEIDTNTARRYDEVGIMARALIVFRNALIELAHSRHGLIQQASMLEEKLQHEQHLMAMQRNFISMASHEFRTPLNLIDGHAQRLIKIKNPVQADDITERAGKVRSAVKQMTALIDNLINAARLFEAKPELYFHPEEVDLAPLLQAVCKEQREINVAAHIIEKIDAKPLTIFGDAKLLTQMFSNLVSNAVKYSSVGGDIEISAARDLNHIRVSVSDNGIGIPEKDIHAIFERYVRGSNVSDIAGTGIGLYLVKMIVELHGGSITVQSLEGQGAIFIVQFPTPFFEDS